MAHPLMIKHEACYFITVSVVGMSSIPRTEPSQKAKMLQIKLHGNSTVTYNCKGPGKKNLNSSGNEWERVKKRERELSVQYYK